MSDFIERHCRCTPSWECDYCEDYRLRHEDDEPDDDGPEESVDIDLGLAV